jgi:hypothetical protein
MGFALVCAALLPAAAHAQEKGKSGVTMGFPASIGLIWHASEKVAVRPEFSFTHSSVDAQGGDTSSDSLGLGASVLFYTAKWDNVSAYVAPRVAWSHGSAESRADVGGFNNESSADSYTYSGSLGAQAWVGTRFSVFGEAGVSYTHGESETSLGTELKNKSFGLRSGVGAILYF